MLQTKPSGAGAVYVRTIFGGGGQFDHVTRILRTDCCSRNRCKKFHLNIKQF